MLSQISEMFSRQINKLPQGSENFLVKVKKISHISGTFLKTNKEAKVLASEPSNYP